MPDAKLVGEPTRGAVFDALVTVARARVVTLVEEGALAKGDAEFLLRALIDLESDGIELFGARRPADAEFYSDVTDYLVARVGRVAVEAPVLVPRTAETFAVLGATEGARVSRLLGLPQAAACGRELEPGRSLAHQPPRRRCMKHKFLVHKRGDHVGVTVVDISAGEIVQGLFMDDDSAIEVEARDAVPFGHKIAIAQLDPESDVLEYGTPIGRTTGPFQPGTYVHTHNLRSARW